MQREPSRLAAAAERVQADLRRTTGKAWTCSVDGEYVLHVSDGAESQPVLLDSDVHDEHWFVPEGATPEQVDDGLDADAEELVAQEAAEALRLFDVEWPVCREHDRILGACSGWWYCGGQTYHDVAAVGSLKAEDVLSWQ